MDELRERVRALIGCDWGSKVTSAVDLGLCGAQAVQRVEVRDPASGRLFLLQFCAVHRDLVLEQTNPRAS